MSLQPWRAQRGPRRHWIHIKAHSDPLSEVQAGALADRLQSRPWMVVLADTVELLTTAYMVSSAERLRTIHEQLDIHLHLTMVETKID